MADPVRKRAGLTEMALVVGDEAARIRTVQAALVKTGERAEPDAHQIRKAEVCEDIERLLFAIMDKQKEVRDVLAPVMRAMATAERFERDRDEAPPAQDDENPTEN